MTLRDLNFGDHFISAKENNKRYPTKWQVRGRPEFNRAAGTATMRCLNLKTGEYKNKHARIEVIKLFVVTA